jgi:hypothetical protein
LSVHPNSFLVAIIRSVFILIHDSVFVEYMAWENTA